MNFMKKIETAVGSQLPNQRIFQSDIHGLGSSGSIKYCFHLYIRKVLSFIAVIDTLVKYYIDRTQTNFY